MAAPLVDSTPDFVANAYAKLEERLQFVRRRLGRPMTYAEKIVLGHRQVDDARLARSSRQGQGNRAAHARRAAMNV